MIIDARGPDGNAMVIMAHVMSLLKQVGREDEVAAIRERMMEGDYENLCRVAEEVTFGTIRIINRDGGAEDEGEE